ncbi:MAG TPA: signal peptidase I [Acidimicrobiales bacterium]|nr:signal peptidase I [Acidimicrobiales bacterium]
MQPLRRAGGAAVLVVAVVLAAAGVKAFVGESYYIPSASMLPGLHLHDRIIVSRLAYDLHDPRRGDVVVFRSPPGVLPPDPATGLRRLGVDVGLVDASQVLVKRVVGLPGDTVTAAGGRVYVDGRLLVEPYLAAGTVTADFGPVRVPPGHLFVMGDNRGDSEDSRIFGPVPTSSVVGRALWRVWPLDRFAPL